MIPFPSEPLGNLENGFLYIPSRSEGEKVYNYTVLPAFPLFLPLLLHSHLKPLFISIELLALALLRRVLGAEGIGKADHGHEVLAFVSGIGVVVAVDIPHFIVVLRHEITQHDVDSPVLRDAPSEGRS